MDQDSLVSPHSGLTMPSQGRQLRKILEVLRIHREKYPKLHRYVNGIEASENDGEKHDNEGDGDEDDEEESEDDEDNKEGGGDENEEESEDDNNGKVSLFFDNNFDFENADKDDEQQTMTEDDSADEKDASDASNATRVDTQVVHKDLDIPEMAELIHRVCKERKLRDRELTVVHYVAVDEKKDLNNLRGAIELSNAKIECRHIIVQQDVIEGLMLGLPYNTSRVSAMLQFLFDMKNNYVVIFEHVDFKVHDNVVDALTPRDTSVKMEEEKYTLFQLSDKKDKFSLKKDGILFKKGRMFAFAELKKITNDFNPDNYRSLAYTFNGKHNQLKRENYLCTLGDIVMCNAVLDYRKDGQNVLEWRKEWTRMQEQEGKKFDKWNDWATVRDDNRRPDKIPCLVVQTLNEALKSSDYARAFIRNVIYGYDPIIPEGVPLYQVQRNIVNNLRKFDQALQPSLMRFVLEFKDMCPTFEDADYEIIAGYDIKNITVSFADYRDTVSVLKNFLEKKISRKKQCKASFLKSYTLQDQREKLKFNEANVDHVKAFVIMCYRKAAWFKRNHMRLLQARYMLQSSIWRNIYLKKKKQSKLRSWATWLLFVVKQIIVMSESAQSAWESLKHDGDDENYQETIASKEMRSSSLKAERNLLGNFRQALLKTSEGLFFDDENEVNSPEEAFKSIKNGLKEGQKQLLENENFSLIQSQEKPKRDRQQTESKRRVDGAAKSIHNMFKRKKKKKKKKGKK